MFSQTKHEDLVKMLETQLKECKHVKDRDLEDHYAELDRYGLFSTEMTSPITSEIDFVAPLLKRYLVDIRER